MRRRRGRRRGRGSGFTLVEVAASAVLLLVGVFGFVATVVHTRNLDRTTTALWRATAGATATLEDVRRDSMGRWEMVESDWDARTVVAQGSANARNGTLRARVRMDPNAVDDGAGMWAPGAAIPNYYHVTVGADDAAGDVATTLRFQTYVADRTGFNSLKTDPYQGPPPAGSEADAIDPAPRGVVCGGATGERLTFTIDQRSGTPVTLKAVQVQLASGEYVQLSVAGVSIYDNPAKPRNNSNLNVPGGALPLPFGESSIVVTGTQPLAGQPVEVTLRFGDSSKRRFTVIP